MSQIIIKIDGEFQGRKIALENAPALELKNAIEGLLLLLHDESPDPTLSLKAGSVEICSPVANSVALKLKISQAKSGSADANLIKFVKSFLHDELGRPSRSLYLKSDDGQMELLARSGEAPMTSINPADRAWETTFGYLKGRLSQIGDNAKNQNHVVLEVPGVKKSRRIPVKGDRAQLAELNRLYPIDSPNVELFVQYRHNFITQEDADYQFIRVAGAKFDPSLIHAAVAKESLAWQGVDTEEWYKEVR
jgi:hypothetical protein